MFAFGFNASWAEVTKMLPCLPNLVVAQFLGVEEMSSAIEVDQDVH